MYSNSVTFKGLHPCTEKCISGNIKKIQKLFGSTPNPNLNQIQLHLAYMLIPKILPAI